MTMRWRPSVSFQAVSTSASGTARASIWNVPLVISAASRGEFGHDVAGRDRALPAAGDLQARGPERGGRDGGGGPGHRADLDPGQRLPPVGAAHDHGEHRVGGGLAPEVVEHDVGIAGGLTEAPGGIVR